MSFELAIVTPQFGVLSQTFVRRHIEQLLPGRTVVIARRVDPSYDGTWDAAVPLLTLDRVTPGLMGRVIGAAARRVGFRFSEQSVVSARRFLRQHNVKVMMGEHLDSSLEWLTLARQLGVRFFGHAHGYDVSSLLRNTKWRTEYLRYNQAAGVITVSHFSRARLIGLGLEPSSVHVVPSGVDVPAEPRLPREGKAVRCLAVGRMIAKKAPILTLDAFRRAVERHDDLQLDFVGAGPLFAAAQQFVRCFRLESRVTLHGAIPNQRVKRMMREADVFIQHSITASDGNEEGLPVAILEAMAAALPVVSTRHAGIPEAVQDGETGYLVEEGDSVGMAERIVRLAGDRERRLTIGHAGWKRAKEAFSWEEERARLSEILGLRS